MFIIRTKEDKERAIDHIREMALLPVQYVDIDDYKKHRSSAQNRFFHKAVKIISEHSGYSPDEVKDKIVLSIWPPIEKTVEVVKSGKVEKHILRSRRSTADLDTKEFSQLVDAVFIIADKLELTLPMPDDFKEDYHG